MNPYRTQPDSAFWSRSVAQTTQIDVDPVVSTKFDISLEDRVATAGSCFAQHLAQTLRRDGYNYLVTETGPLSAGARDESYGLFPARFANIYTVRQLLQLFERAYGLFAPQDVAWRRRDGSWVDPFRPRIQEQGFRAREDVVADRDAHLGAVREMFETSDVFIFTLGLTEAWRNENDNAVFPLAPGVAGLEDESSDFRFVNFEVDEMIADLRTFIERLRVLNPGIRVLLTVSPIPLIATFEPRHVLVSTAYSKAALRVVADRLAREEGVDYFPSYEIITGQHAGGSYFEEDLREVRSEGVAHVMSVFKRHYLGTGGPVRPARPREVTISERVRAEMEATSAVICDEEAIEKV